MKIVAGARIKNRQYAKGLVDKFDNADGGTANVNINLSGELTVKGRDLIYAPGKENFKTDIWGE